MSTLINLSDKDVDNTLWLRAYSRNFKATCCGCGGGFTPIYVATAIVGESRFKPEWSQKLKSCISDKHGICTLCLSCGKKLGFEW